MQHLKALLILLAHLLLLVLAAPGFELEDAEEYDSRQEQAEAAEELGQPWGWLAVHLALWNRDLREPLVAPIDDIQRPFRARQAWHLYQNGPNRVRRLEIRVDGQLLHRSADPAYPWRDAQLRNRRLRPVAEKVAIRPGSANWRGLTRWIVAEARADHPGAQEVTITATSARFPGTEAQARHRYVARAPDWKVREQRGQP